MVLLGETLLLRKSRKIFWDTTTFDCCPGSLADAIAYTYHQGVDVYERKSCPCPYIEFYNIKHIMFSVLYDHYSSFQFLDVD